MELFAFLLPFVMLLKPSWCVLCYRCDPERPPYISNTSLCRHFDYSQKFEVNCDGSTMCLKKITYLKLNNGLPTLTEQRGCAPQTMSGDQEKINGKWRYVKKIYEVYDEACTEDANDLEKPATTILCYCRGDLCNSAHKTGTLGIITVLLGLLTMS